MENLITVSHINKIFYTAGKEFQALKDINLTISQGELVILKGRSGSGKTTLLNLLSALDTPTSGEVSFQGKLLHRMSEGEKENLRRRAFGFVFQAVSLYPSMTAYQNVEFAMLMAGMRKGTQPRIEECLKAVGLGGRMKHMPAEMSGGEQQRVAIARAMAHHPKVIFADEPTAELDSAMAAEVTRMFYELTRREQVTVIMTTHDAGLMDAGDRIIELESGQQVFRENNGDV